MTMNIKAYITTELFDRDGKLIFRWRRRSKSFVQALLAILYSHVRQADNTVSYKDIGGTLRLIRNSGSSFALNAGDNDSSYGLVVGTGSGAVAVTDYVLQTQIVHGTGSGQLDHGADSFGSLTISDPNASFTIYRDFLNSSGATITVNEEGLYAGANDTGAVTRFFCIVRDVEAAGIAVADGQNLRVTYTIQTST